MEGRSKPKGAAGGTNRMISLMQKPICSPSKPSEPAPRYPPKSQSLFLRNKVNPSSSEPTSPKVTCAGQVKDRHGKSEQRRRRRERKKSPIKFLSSLRRLQLDAVRCFQCPQGLSHGNTDDEGGEQNEGEENCTPTGIMVSRWFMTAAGENDVGAPPPGEGAEEVEEKITGKEADSTAKPPPNALSLMRCCSAKCPVEKGQLDEADALSSTA